MPPKVVGGHPARLGERLYGPREEPYREVARQTVNQHHVRPGARLLHMKDQVTCLDSGHDLVPFRSRRPGRWAGRGEYEGILSARRWPGLAAPGGPGRPSAQGKE